MTEVKRWLAIDYGQVRVGVALSDALGFTAQGLTTIQRKGGSLEDLAAKISSLADQHAVSGIVVGIPRRTDGKPGPSEEDARQLAQLLDQLTQAEIIQRDERYTTVMATGIMRESGVNKKRYKEIVDQIAAEIILQEFLESLRKG